MSGHRRRTGQEPKPTRAASRIAEHKRRVHTAPTGRLQMSAAFDRLRSAAVRAGGGDELLRQLATDINDMAVGLERQAA